MKSFIVFIFILFIMPFNRQAIAEEFKCRSVFINFDNSMILPESLVESLIKLNVNIQKELNIHQKSNLMTKLQEQIQAAYDLYGQTQTDLLLLRLNNEIYLKQHEIFKEPSTKKPSTADIIKSNFKFYPIEWGYYLVTKNKRITYLGEFTTKPPLELAKMDFTNDREIIDIKNFGRDHYLILKSNLIVIWNHRSNLIQQELLHQPATEIKQVLNTYSTSGHYFVLFKNGQFQFIGDNQKLNPHFIHEINLENMNNIALMNLPMSVGLIKTTGEIKIIDFQKSKIKVGDSVRLLQSEKITSADKNPNSQNAIAITSHNRRIYFEVINHEIRSSITDDVQQSTMNDYALALLTNQNEIRISGGLLHPQFIDFIHNKINFNIEHILLNQSYIVLQTNKNDYQILKLQTGLGKQNPPRILKFNKVQKMTLNNDYILIQLQNNQLIFVGAHDTYELKNQYSIREIVVIDELGFVIFTSDQKVIFVGYNNQLSSVQEYVVTIDQFKTTIGTYPSKNNLLIVYEDGTTQLINEFNKNNLNYNPTMNKQPGFYLENTHQLDVIMNDVISKQN